MEVERQGPDKDKGKRKKHIGLPSALLTLMVVVISKLPQSSQIEKQKNDENYFL